MNRSNLLLQRSAFKTINELYDNSLRLLQLFQLQLETCRTSTSPPALACKRGIQEEKKDIRTLELDYPKLKDRPRLFCKDCGRITTTRKKCWSCGESNYSLMQEGRFSTH